jgi:cellulose synthase/poly-beta-1,6-N-acetylglucosamine synthase-like glycosyltransferase
MSDTLLAVVALGAFGLVVYSYAGYGGLLWLLSTAAPRRALRAGAPPAWPRVSIIVSAYNEESVIAERVRNLLALDYPAARLEILVGSDGSTDRTAAIVERFTGERVRLFAFTANRGKASVLNDLLARATGDVVVLTDANTFFQPRAVRALVRGLWRHPAACAVVGRLDLRAAAGGGNLDGLYWRYECWLKTLESRFGAVLGANGAIYAFARRRYRPLPPTAIVDDFLIPMLMRQGPEGGEVVFLPSAAAWETCPASVRHELRRRMRIGAGDLQALLWTWRLLLPWRGMVALAYFSHKVLRWLTPWLLLAGGLATLGLRHRPFFQALIATQVSSYTLGALAPALRGVPVVGRLATMARYFIVLNVGLALGWIRFALGRQRATWSSTPRTVWMGGPEMAPQTPQRSGRPGGAVASLDSAAHPKEAA